MRGMLFLPFCLCRETLLHWPTNRCTLRLVRRTCCLASIQRRDGLSIQTSRAINLWFDVVSALARRGNQAAGDGLANTTVLFLQNNPRPIFHRVSPQDSRYAAQRRIFWGAFSAAINGGIGTASCVELSPIRTPGGFMVAS